VIHAPRKAWTRRILWSGRVNQKMVQAQGAPHHPVAVGRVRPAVTHINRAACSMVAFRQTVSRAWNAHRYAGLPIIMVRTPDRCACRRKGEQQGTDRSGLFWYSYSFRAINPKVPARATRKTLSLPIMLGLEFLLPVAAAAQ